MLKKPDKSIKDSGERMIPAYHKGHMVFGEHIVRYNAAMELVNGKIILDIASGSGYGTSLLSSKAKKAYGVDIDSEAIEYANKNYGNSKTKFIKGDGSTIPLEDASVDIVVSFETIEHIKNYRQFMKEISRVLKTDGLLILSTPNKQEFPKGNHYHVHEFESKELNELVLKFFKYSKNYFQTTWLYNLLSEEGNVVSEWDEAIKTMHTAPVNIKHALYYFVLCSNRKITEVITPQAAISEHWSARIIQEYEESIRAHIEDQGRVIESLDNSLRLMRKRYRFAEKIFNLGKQ